MGAISPYLTFSRFSGGVWVPYPYPFEGIGDETFSGTVLNCIPVNSICIEKDAGGINELFSACLLNMAHL